jgi:cell division protein FtsX
MTPKLFLTTWHSLVRDRTYAVVVVFGLAIAIAAAWLLLGFVRYSLTYNAAIPHVERTYVLKQRYNAAGKQLWFDQAPVLLRQAAERLPDVEAATSYAPARPQNRGLAARVGARLVRLDGLVVLPSFPAVLGVTALEGDVAHTLLRAEGIVLTRAAAMRLFGTAPALGRTLRVEGQAMQVGAVVPTPPPNTTIRFEALVGPHATITAEVNDELRNGQQGWWLKSLVRLRPGANPGAVQAALQAAADASPILEQQRRGIDGRIMDVALERLQDAYFDLDVASNYVDQAGPRADRSVVLGLGALALVILALAAANYVNLASLRAMRRQRETALRKVLGARLHQVAGQIVCEALLVALLATLLGLALAWLALSMFAQLVDRPLDGMFTPAGMAAALALGSVLGLLTAVYPAWIAVRVPPAQVLAGRDGETVHGLKARRALTAIQVAAAMAVGGIALAVAWQAGYGLGQHPGFQAEQLIIVDVPETVKDSPRAQAFVSALRTQPEVAGVTISGDAVGRHDAILIRELKRSDGRHAPMDFKSVANNFFEVYDIRPVAGRLFSAAREHDDDPAPLVLNAVAARALGFAEPEAALGQTVWLGGGKPEAKTVIGIAPELRFHSLREKPAAVAYELWTQSTTLTVRAAGSRAAAAARIEALWRRHFPDSLLRMAHADAVLAADYADDTRLAQLLVLATLVALAIAGFGSYVLAALSVQHRRREIVLRRLHGARTRDIALLLLKEQGRLMLLSALIGLPLAAVCVERYLAAFAQRAPMAFASLAVSSAVVIVLSLAAMTRHARAALRLMPADALRFGEPAA